MTLRELLKDQNIDPNALLRQQIGTKLEQGGGVTLRLEDGMIDIHVLVPRGALPGKEKS